MKQPKLISQAQLQTLPPQKGVKTSLILNSKVTGVNVKFLLFICRLTSGPVYRGKFPCEVWKKDIHVIDYR